MDMEDQRPAIDFLSNLSRATERLDTHISIIILSGDRAYKLKRSVRFPYLDFSTAERRLSACMRELELNRRTAPSLYIAVRRITREVGGRLTFDGTGEMIDSVVEMVRFDQRSLFSQIAERHELNPELLTKTALAISDFHRAAAVDHERSGSAIMAGVISLNSQSIKSARIFDGRDADTVDMRFKSALEQLSALLDEREKAGKVRRCHGDLHLRNICLLGDTPTLFDCLEFDEHLATTDVLYDLAFLLMDLWHQGLRAEANWVFNRYFDSADEDDGISLMPFFMAVRAIVRAHVGAAQAAGRNTQAFKEACAYFELARSLLNFAPARLVALGGLSGSGKSSVAAAAADRLGPPPGARVLSSDRIRKRLYGVPAEMRLPLEAYQPDVSKRVYTEQARTATIYLRNGHAVIADAVFDRAEDRQRIEAAVPRSVPFKGFWLDAPFEVLVDRVNRRAGDPSDATASVWRQQASRLTTTEWQLLPSGEGVTKAAATLIELIQPAAPDAAENTEP
jgi:uncharacterized protein